VEEIGLFGYKLTIPSPSYSYETVELDSGEIIVIDQKLNPRELTAEFLTKARDYKDALEQKSLLFTLLGNGKDFYVEQTHHPNILWKVKMGEWTPQFFNGRITNFTIPLTCHTGVAQSINLAKKTFTESNFIYKNEGSVLIDPRKHSETEIVFKGPSTDLSITNKRTGESWSYNGTTSANDVITLKGVRALKNGVSIFKDTNKRILTFESGINEIEALGVDGSFELSIITRFYFL